MDIEKMFIAACKALGIAEDSSPADLKAAIDAAASAKDAQQKLADIQAGKKAEPEAPADDPKPEEVPEELSAVPALSRVKASDATPATTPATAEATTIEASAPTTDATSLADSPEAIDAAAKQVFEKLSQALGKDAAGVVAFVSDNLDKLAALAGAQPDSGQPSDKPADAPPAMSAADEAKLAAEQARSAELAKEVNELRAFKLAQERREKEGAAHSRVEKAIETGRVLASEREHLIKFALSAGVEAFDAYIKDRPQAVPTGRVMSAAEPSVAKKSDAQLNEQEEALVASLVAFGTPRAAAIELATSKEKRAELHAMGAVRRA